MTSLDQNAGIRGRNLAAVAAHEAQAQRSHGIGAGFNGRWTRRHWAHASLFAAIGALLAALVPGFSVAMQTPPRVQKTSMALALPPLTALRSQSVAVDGWQTVSVQRGQTLSDIFAEQGIAKSDLALLLKHPGVKDRLRRLQPGTELAFELPPANARKGATALRAFRFDRDDEHRVVLRLKDGKVHEEVIQRPVTSRVVVISGEVGKSLFHSARKQGLSAQAINTLTDDIFKYDIDFDSDVGAKDRYSVVVEQRWREGELLGNGPVLAATFTAGGKLHTGFRVIRNGKPEYFTADGRPLKKSFIRMPIPYARLSSGFGGRRHPILGSMRMHKGVDYAAATGTPIMAAGDARVAFAGWKGGYGRTVILDHGRGYETLYAHMSGFGNIRAGQRIAQGTVIGRVGTSGLSTGPHLHYEFRVGGVHRNPLSITMPPPEPLRGDALQAFHKQTALALTRIREVENVIYQDPDAERRLAQALAPTGKGRKG